LTDAAIRRLERLAELDQHAAEARRRAEERRGKTYPLTLASGETWATRELMLIRARRSVGKVARAASGHPWRLDLDPICGLDGPVLQWKEWLSRMQAMLSGPWPSLSGPWPTNALNSSNTGQGTIQRLPGDCAP